MSGVRNGVQALVKSEANQALYVHCLAHNLNLCLKDVTKASDLVRNVMGFIYDLIQLIKFSPKRLTLFESLKKEVSINSGDSTPSLRMLCPTRWTIRYTSIDGIIRNFQILQTALEEIQQGHDEYAAKASGLMVRMENFDTYFALKLAYLVFSAAEQLSVNLQAKDITVQEAINGAKLLTTHLMSLRNEVRFNIFYDRVCQDCRDLTEEPQLPRHRKRPRRLDEGAGTHQYQDPKERYRHAYFEVLESAAGEVERSFDQADLHIIKEIEVLMLKAANGEIIDSIPPVIHHYLDKDVDRDRLKTQLSLVCDMIKTALSGSIPIQTVTNVRTIAEAMNKGDIYKTMLSEVDKILKLYFTFPVTTATAERSFSSLRRIKMFLRSTMTDCRLNNLFLLYIHTCRTDALDLSAIAKDFVTVNSRRINYYGKFST